MKYDLVAPGVFAFDMWTKRECAAFLRTAALKGNSYPASPNSMNKYGAVVGGDLRETIAYVTRTVIQHISDLEYEEIPSLKKHPYAFLVDYDMKTQRSLAAHFDSSYVTLNVCLGHKFTGGDLVFHNGGVRTTVKHEIGRAIVHRGSHVHRAKPLTAGTRSNLILWCDAKSR